MARTKPLPLLTRAETEIMQVLWSRGDATVHDVVEAAKRPLAYTTVLTMLRLLEQKGYATHAPSPDGGRAHVYRAAVTEAGARRSHLRDFVDRLFAGRPEELVMGLVNEASMSRAELEQLRAAIDAKLAGGEDEKKRGKR
jgi:predicted transcriptional regulator